MLNGYASNPYQSSDYSDALCSDQSPDCQFDTMCTGTQGGCATMPSGVAADPYGAMAGGLATADPYGSASCVAPSPYGAVAGGLDTCAPCEDGSAGAGLCSSPYAQGATGGMSGLYGGPALTGNVENDSGSLEDMVEEGAPPSLTANFAGQVAQEAQTQGNNAYQSWAENIATNETNGSISVAGARRDFDALPYSGKDMTNGQNSAADDNFASKDPTAYAQFEADVKKGGSAPCNDLKDAVKDGDLSEADASTLMSEMNGPNPGAATLMSEI